MARKYTLAGADFANIVTFVEAAIADYYGVGNYTIHYTDATNIIFSIPSIFDKVIKMDFGSRYDLRFYFGDAWTSGTTITNSVDVMIDIYWQIVAQNMYLILDSKFIAFTTPIEAMLFAYYGKLSNEESIAFSFGGATGAYAAQYRAYKTNDPTNMLEPHILNVSMNSILSESGKYLKLPIMFLNANYTPLCDDLTHVPLSPQNIYCTQSLPSSEYASNYIFRIYSTWYSSGYYYALLSNSPSSLVIDLDNYSL
jgi:hypothetical protein